MQPLLTAHAIRASLVFFLCACAPVDPGQVRFLVTGSPPPDDKVLSPLLDPRLTTLELRAREPKGPELLLSRARYERGTGGTGDTALGLGNIPVGGKRDLRLFALGAGGQQVLGLALSPDVEIAWGARKELTFELRRPLFFFGGRKLVPPVPLHAMDQPLSPGRRIPADLRDEAVLRVVDPNSTAPGAPLLSSYNLTVEAGQPPLCSAATADGLSVLVVTAGGTLSVVQTMQIKPSISLKLAATMPAQYIAISPRDDSAVILHHTQPAAMTGKVGQLTFLRELQNLRARINPDGAPLVRDVESTLAMPLSEPIMATYAPDGLVDVIFSRYPVRGGEPNCAQLAGPGKSVLRRYDPRTGEVRGQVALEYTTSVAYTASGEQVLVQPCSKAPKGTRLGQVVIGAAQGDVGAARARLPAPGTASVVVGAESVLVAVGRDDTADPPQVPMMPMKFNMARGVVRFLEPGFNDWTQVSFPLSELLQPLLIELENPSAVELVLAPTDLTVYRVVAPPDRSRILALTRVTHQVSRLPIEVDLLDNVCYLDWKGYTYHVMVLNLQTGAKEHDFVTGVQNEICESQLVDKTNKVLGTCFPCDYKVDANRTIRMRGYQEGILPTGASALFSGN
jgi:hypothetical protein